MPTGGQNNYRHDSRTRLLGELILCTCLPSSVSLSCWWCPMVSGSLDVCLQLPPLICLPVWQVVPGSPDVSLYWSPFIFLPVCLRCPALRMCVFACLFLFASPSGWWRPALWMPLFNSFCILTVSHHLAPFLAGGVRLFGCVSSLVSLHLSPMLSSGVRLSGCLLCVFTCLSSRASQLICLQFIGLPLC